MLGIYNQEEEGRRILSEYKAQGKEEGRAEERSESIKSNLKNIRSMLQDGFSWTAIRKHISVPSSNLPEIIKVFPEYAGDQKEKDN